MYYKNLVLKRCVFYYLLLGSLLPHFVQPIGKKKTKRFATNNPLNPTLFLPNKKTFHHRRQSFFLIKNTLNPPHTFSPPKAKQSSKYPKQKKRKHKKNLFISMFKKFNFNLADSAKNIIFDNKLCRYHLTRIPITHPSNPNPKNIIFHLSTSLFLSK